MLPKKERLKDRRLFNLTFKKRQKRSSNLLTVYYLFPINKKDINYLPKTSFIAGLNIDKRATKRNQIKRRMREAYKLIKKKLITTNNNILSLCSVLIFIANPNIKSATFEQIRETMLDLLTKIRYE